MKKIYFDYNIILELLDFKEKEPALYLSLLTSMKKNNIFYYSYGHIEEIYCNNKYNHLNRLNILSEITNNNEILFQGNLRYHFLKEDIKDCYRRVAGDVGFNEYIDEGNKHKTKLHIEKYDDFPDKNKLNHFDSKDIFLKYEANLGLHMEEKLKDIFFQTLGTMQGEHASILFLNNKWILENFNLYKKCYSMFMNISSENFENDISLFFDKPRIFETLMEHIFDFLYEIGFWKEDHKKNSTYRSKVYDVTHAIFASKTDTFFTFDKRFYHKLKVTYDLLGIKTKLILLDPKNFISSLEQHLCYE